MAGNGLRDPFFQVSQFIGPGSGQSVQKDPGRAVVPGRIFSFRIGVVTAVQPAPGHVAQLAGAVKVQHGRQHCGRRAAPGQQGGVGRHALFRQGQFCLPKAFVNRLQIHPGQVVPNLCPAGGAGSGGALFGCMAVHAAVKAAHAVAGRELARHEQGDGTAAQAVFIQQHVAPVVHGHLFARVAQILHRKALAQQIGIAVAQVGKIGHEFIPLQADFLGQFTVKIEVIAVCQHADAGPVGPFAVFLVEAVQVIAHKGAQHEQIFQCQHDKGFMDDKLDFELLQQGFHPFKHGAPAGLKSLIQRAAQRVQNGKPGLGGGVGHAHVHNHAGPIRSGHALAGGVTLKTDAGHGAPALTALGVHPDIQLVCDQHFLILQGSVQQDSGFAPPPHLQPARHKLHAHRKLIKIAPDLKTRQGQKHVIRKKEPKGLFRCLAHLHAAVVEQGLPHGRGQRPLPADPQHMPRGAHAHFPALRQAGQ